MTCEDMKVIVDKQPADCTNAEVASVVAHLYKCRGCRSLVNLPEDYEWGSNRDELMETSMSPERHAQIWGDPESGGLIRQAFKERV